MSDTQKKTIYNVCLEVEESTSFEHMTLFTLVNPDHEFILKLIGSMLTNLLKLPKSCEIIGERKLGEKQVDVYLVKLEDRSIVETYFKLYNNKLEGEEDGLILHITKKKGIERKIGDTIKFSNLKIKEVGPKDPILKFPLEL